MEEQMGSECKSLRRYIALSLAVGAIWWGQSAQAANYYVDLNYTGTNGAAYNGYAGAYNSIAAALGASGVGSGASPSNPNKIFIAAGTYNVGTTSLAYSKNNVDLIGLTGNSNDVVITSTLDSLENPGSGAIGTTGSATLQLKGNNVAAANITFANSTDTPHIDNVTHMAPTPSGSYTGTAQTASQPAVALLLQGDEQTFSNCQVLGYQDTLYVKGGRAEFNNCTINGDDDAIFASGTVVFENSTINIDGNHSGGCLTAASTDKRTSNGLVFLNNVITGNSVQNNPVIDMFGAATASGPVAGSMYLGRPWGWTQTGGDASAVFIDNTFQTSAINAAGWLAWDSTETTATNGKNGGNPGEDSRFAEYGNVDGSNNPINVASRVSWSHQLTASQAAAYTDTNVFSVESSYPWYGQGYPSGDASSPGTGSPNPTDSNYSWPAYWGDRNLNNESANDLVTSNPTSYSDPSWTIAGNFNAAAQIASVPEPTSVSLILGGSVLLLKRRRSRQRLVV
jgi:pectin methylesterase-like acyl-CoA thioesterase